MKNYSKQRETIIEILKNSKSHPTAKEVFEKAKEILPSISLGTVYRNLKALAKDGDLLEISVGDGFEHFDGDISPHIHLHCKECGSIYDVPLPEDIPRIIAEKEGFKAKEGIYILNGICKSCLKN